MREKDDVVVHHVHVGNKFGTRLGNRELGLEPRSPNKSLWLEELVNSGHAALGRTVLPALKGGHSL